MIHWQCHTSFTVTTKAINRCWKNIGALKRGGGSVTCVWFVVNEQEHDLHGSMLEPISQRILYHSLLKILFKSKVGVDSKRRCCSKNSWPALGIQFWHLHISILTPVAKQLQPAAWKRSCSLACSGWVTCSQTSGSHIDICLHLKGPALISWGDKHCLGLGGLESSQPWAILSKVCLWQYKDHPEASSLLHDGYIDPDGLILTFSRVVTYHILKETLSIQAVTAPHAEKSRLQH